MTKLKTSYMGLELRNPIIVGASSLVNNIENLKKMEAAGAAAVVYRSLFEEQIQLEAAQMDEELDEYAERHAEMTSLFPTLEHAGPAEHLMNVKKAKQVLGIPLIASLNAVYRETWLEYAKLLEDAGVTEEMLQRAHLRGSRRAARLLVGDLEITPVAEGLQFSFSLPKGAYATTLLREFIKADSALEEEVA